ncbi:hypothetical protein AQ946_23565 [Burkholderia pseudomallei]|nr:hypothetical protein AQ946_23565 [Burkholderia pseudomallei]ONE31417.1 hypothetical protein AQ948_25115 [Burkholderia pseudomallei]ONE37946.1 hypothetical protein AQ947_16205 [Burkholderia pseudomallei]
MASNLMPLEAELADVVKRQHTTIDRLLAMLIQRDPDFLPTQDAMFALHTARDALNVLDKVTAKRKVS